MKILIPIDFSDCALNALRYALHLWEKMKGEIILYHAFHIPIGGDATFFVDAEMVKQREQSLQKRMLEIGDKITKLKSLPHQYLTSMAMPTEGILKTIREHNIDLIVMGTKGANHLSDEWLGSTTYNVVRKASCPVIAVPEFMKGFYLKEIALASDLHPLDNPSAFSFLRNLAKQFDARIHILHIHPHPEHISIEQGEEAVVLDKIFHSIPHTYHFPDGTDVEEELQRFIQAHSIDMLAMIPRKHNLLERLLIRRITKKMTLHTEIPLLSIYA